MERQGHENTTEQNEAIGRNMKEGEVEVESYGESEGEGKKK